MICPRPNLSPAVRKFALAEARRQADELSAKRQADELSAKAVQLTATPDSEMATP